MQKRYILAVSAISFLLPLAAFAITNVSTDFHTYGSGDPVLIDTFNNAANVFMLYPDPGGGNCASSQSGGGCVNFNNFAGGADITTKYSVAGTSFTLPDGSYSLIESTNANCFPLDAAACKVDAASLSYWDFTIGATSSPATSTEPATLIPRDELLSYLLYIVDALWFFVCVALIYYGVIKVFPQLKIT